MVTVPVKVHLTTLGSDDTAKTTKLIVNAIQRVGDEETFMFPKVVQDVKFHPLLLEVSAVKGAKKNMTSRHMRRTVRVTLKDELAKEYLDDDGNFWFKGEYLDSGVVKFVREDNATTDTEDSDTTVHVRKRTLHNIQKEIVLDKFNGRNYHALTWLQMFEDECQRVEVENDQFVDVLRLMLEGYTIEWYLAMKKRSA